MWAREREIEIDCYNDTSVSKTKLKVGKQSNHHWPPPPNQTPIPPTNEVLRSPCWTGWRPSSWHLSWWASLVLELRLQQLLPPPLEAVVAAAAVYLSTLPAERLPTGCWADCSTPVRMPGSLAVARKQTIAPYRETFGSVKLSFRSLPVNKCVYETEHCKKSLKRYTDRQSFRRGNTFIFDSVMVSTVLNQYGTALVVHFWVGLTVTWFKGANLNSFP